MAKECEKEHERVCPWGPKEWREFGAMVENQEAMHETMKEIKAKVSTLAERVANPRRHGAQGGAAAGGVVTIIIALGYYLKDKIGF